MPRQYTRIPLADRFWPKVDKNGPFPLHAPDFGQCWVWTASTYPNGYGAIGVHAGKLRQAHRIAWEIADGPIPGGLSVLHTCDNHACVRNDSIGVYVVNGVEHVRRGHLWLGAQADNCADMKMKGRSTIGDRNPSRIHPEKMARGDSHPARLRPEYLSRGESHYAAKLSGADVVAIRKAAKNGAVLASLARLYGVTNGAIGHIVRRKNWKHVE
jgi:hypothetical protein